MSKFLTIVLFLSFCILQASEGLWKRILTQSDNAIGIGASNVTTSVDQHTTLVISSELYFPLDKYTSLWLVTQGNGWHYRNNEFNIGSTTLGIRYHLKDMTVGVGVGVGAAINYSTLMSKFRQSYDFGPAFRLAVDYPLSKSWSATLSYQKIYLNTNVTEAPSKIMDATALHLSWHYRLATLIHRLFP